MDIQNITVEELENIAKNPGKSGLTLRQFLEVVKILKTLKAEAEVFEEQNFIQLTFWGKVKSLFSKRPVYVKGDNLNGKKKR